MKDSKDPGTMELAMDTRWPAAINIESALWQIKTKLEERQKQYNEVKAMMEVKKAMGLIYAGTHYKAGKYLYLIYPTNSNGDRQRVYVGADEGKIKEALNGIERGVEYKRLETRLQKLERDAHECHNYLAIAHRNISS